MGDLLHNRALITRGYPWDRSPVGPKAVLVSAIDGKNTQSPYQVQNSDRKFTNESVFTVHDTHTISFFNNLQMIFRIITNLFLSRHIISLKYELKYVVSPKKYVMIKHITILDASLMPPERKILQYII
jgi:hypothetical protein